MRMQKFQAGNMREALAKIKRDLGPQAMVISTRSVRRGLLGTGVEVTAAIDDDGGAADVAKPAAMTRTSTALPESDVERIMGPLRAELRSLRTLIRSSSNESRGAEDLRAE